MSVKVFSFDDYPRVLREVNETATHAQFSYEKGHFQARNTAPSHASFISPKMVAMYCSHRARFHGFW